MKHRDRHDSQRGAVLITTLIVLTVLAIVAVAFMQSSSNDQLASRSVSGAYQAQLLAEAGIGTARGTLANLITRYPDSVTVWQNIGGASTNEATVLYVRALAATNTVGALPSDLGTNVAFLAQPLVSGFTNPIGLSALSSALPFIPTDPDLVNLNATNSSRPEAFVGTRSMTNPGAPVTAARWIYVGRLPGPTNATNPPVGRYAYWVEDESFKVNANVATSGNRGTNAGTNPAQITLDGAWVGSSNAALIQGASQGGTADVVAARGGDTNAGFFPTAATVAIAGGVGDVRTASDLRFLTTVHSAGLDLSRGGVKRFNINTITNNVRLQTNPALYFSSDQANPASNNMGVIRTNLMRFVAAITNSNSAPLFGQRFYRLNNNVAGINNTNAVATSSNSADFAWTNYIGTNHALIYLLKLAANVFDYMDLDSQPTVLNLVTDPNLYGRGTNFWFHSATEYNLTNPLVDVPTFLPGRNTNQHQPVFALGKGTDGTNPVIAFGAEAGPRLQEYAIHARIRSMRWDANDPESFGFNTNTPPSSTTANYEVWIDHYFEFWNPGTKAVVVTNALPTTDFNTNAHYMIVTNILPSTPDQRVTYMTNPWTLRIFDQPAWGTNGDTGPITNSNRSTTEIPITNVTFPAQRITILTTAPATSVNAAVGAPTNANALINLGLMGDELAAGRPPLVVSLDVPNADRVFVGTTTNTTNVTYNNLGFGPAHNYNRIFRLPMRARSTGSTDYRSGVVIGNGYGLLESFVGLPLGNLGGGAPTFTLAVSNGFIRDGLSHTAGQGIGPGNNDNLRGGSLLGNQNATTWPSSYEGDPRALLEQLQFLNSAAGGTADYTNITRFFNTIGPTAGGSINLASSSVGEPNFNFVFPNRWSDVSSITSGTNNAPLIVRNGPMESIGELGFITDPARPYYTINAQPVLARGGARTLRVGQPEVSGTTGSTVSWYASNQTQASRTWTSWRLADIFTVRAAFTNDYDYPTNPATNVGSPSFANAVNIRIPGLINPNGALRDNGAALRAAFHGLTFLPSPDGAPSIANRPALVDNVLTNVVARLTNGNAAGMTNALNPFWERGEISELTVFNSASSSTLVAGQIMSNTFDRGREELVRRSIEMITTRGSVYTVYAIGQSLRVTGNTTNITGTVRAKSTFELTPLFQFPTNAIDDTFNPLPLTGSDQIRYTRRYLRPTNYVTRIITTSYD